MEFLINISQVSLIINGAMSLFILHLHFFFISNSAALNQCAGSSLGYLYWINYKCEKYSFYANTQKRLVFPTLFLVKWQLNINSHKYNVIICSIVHKNMNAPTVVLCWLMIGQPIESLVYWLNTITSQSRVHGSYRKQLNNLKQSETVHCKRQWCEDVGSALLTTDFKCSLFCSLELCQIKLCNCNHIVRFKTIILTIILKFIIIFTLLVAEPVLDDDDWTQVFVLSATLYVSCQQRWQKYRHSILRGTRRSADTSAKKHSSKRPSTDSISLLKSKNVQALKCNQSKKVKSCSLGDISIFVQS